MAFSATLGVTPPIITEGALKDIDEICEFIARDSEYHADQVRQAIFATCRAAAANPVLGHRRPEFSERPLMFLSVKRYETYTIAYVESSEPLLVLRVLHGARSFVKAFRV